ncbi:MAG: adenosylcobinamide-GDP ribazoletransferase [Lachnospiraceae bacterium]|nr:adenosylcobinamide-GDP ribazoletransferase [Lachnospiraceae bacterium]
MLKLITGPPDSGKSLRAEELAVQGGRKNLYYLATMKVMDAEGSDRVKKHRAQREGKGFATIEQPYDIIKALDVIKAPKESTVLLECLSNLVGNELHDNPKFEDLRKLISSKKICNLCPAPDEPGKADHANADNTDICMAAGEFVDHIVNEVRYFSDCVAELIVVSTDYDTKDIEDIETLNYICLVDEVSRRLGDSVNRQPEDRDDRKFGNSEDRQHGDIGKRAIRWLAVSFALYSRIPMPRFEMDEDDMAHSLMFFPAVGAVIGMAVYLFNLLLLKLSVPDTARVFVTLLIPIVITGGFHLDGFMDTEDALRSYAAREKKLEILKDPHIGSFAVIGLAVYLLVVLSALSVIIQRGNPGMMLLAIPMLMMSRALSGLTSFLLPKAKKDGMLYAEAGNKHGSVIWALAVWLLISVIVMICFGIIGYMSFGVMVTIVISFAATFIIYKNMVIRQFGGVTGDTAGYLVSVSEGAAVVLTALFLLS